MQCLALKTESCTSRCIPFHVLTQPAATQISQYSERKFCKQ